jgi:hypothetical protein
MKLPVETKPALWGFAAGAAALAFVGFAWGGWMTAGKAEAAAVLRADATVVSTLAPMCVDRFQHAAESAGNLVALKKIDSWSQGDFVDKGGWAKLPGSTITPDRQSAVARACAALLVPA